MKKFFKITGIIIAVIIVISIIGGLMDNGDSKTKSTTGAPEPKEEAAPAKPKIEVLSINEKSDAYSSSVYAEIRNNTDKTATYCDFKSIYLDESGAVIGSGIGNLSDLAPGQTKTTQIISMDDVSNAKKYRVEVGTVLWE